MAQDEYIYKRFPEFTDVIQQLKDSSSTFETVCTDYEEMCAWIHAQGSRFKQADFEAWAQAKDLTHDLENEIINFIGKHHDGIG